MSYNHWTATALANDIHAGDPVEAQMIIAENNLRDHTSCGLCGGPAHYKHSVGVHKCIRCGAAHVSTRVNPGETPAKFVREWIKL
ncbi:hypothetical protein PQD13_gp11 [Gordonia phage Clawz]|uniref:Uncharacterized protein n=1 Tax=Gordonia phage Clawz TaxID=2743910 RepID=A0AAE7F8R5_9CAUD|nr:hypothetical protein PQD13_gp11 [Gordonia phage Clawz]QKY79923.1 hypothetical protein SEA_CLAWZ_11 [Gordonia phage Clawz]